jgi:hypothetical protein
VPTDGIHRASSSWSRGRNERERQTEGRTGDMADSGVEVNRRPSTERPFGKIADALM